MPDNVAPPDRRRRFAKACDSCRVKKVKCDGKRPACGRCQELSIACNYADVSKPPARQRRLRHTSGRESAQQDDSRDELIGSETGVTLSKGSQVQITAPQFNPSSVSGRSGVALLSHSESRESVSGQSSALSQDSLLGGSQDLRYFGSSSAIALLRGQQTQLPQQSPATQRRLRTEETNSEAGPWSLWTHHRLQPVFQRKVHYPLPCWAESFSLVRTFFEEKHMALPLFHPPAFMSLLGQQYSGDFDGGPAWWTAINAILAIAQRRRAEEGDSAADAEAAWGYAANALDTILDILMRATQLMSVQALLVLAWFFLGTPNPQPSFMLVANAIRLAHSIGLHRKECSSSLSPVEKATRVNVFWFAFSLDRELSLRTGRPPAQDFRDFQVDLPDPLMQLEFSTRTAPDVTPNVFCAVSRLAVIQASLYSRMYLSERLDSRSIVDATRTLADDLAGWRHEFVPLLDLESGAELARHPAIVRLNYTYYHCVILVNRAQSDLEWKSRDAAAGEGSLPTCSSPSIQCSVYAARSILGMRTVVSDACRSFNWDVIPVNVTAVLVLSLYAIRQPDAANSEDLDLVSGALGRLASLEREEPESYLRPVRAVCYDVYDTARMAVASSGHGPRNAVASHITRTVHEVCPVAPGASSGAAQEAVSAPFGLDIQSDFIGNPNARLAVIGAVTWDQTMLDSWGVPWEFDSLLGELG